MALIFPSKNFIINQSAGIDREGNNLDCKSHMGYRAIDFNHDEDYLLAPCDLKCVYHQRRTTSDPNVLTAFLTVYESTEVIKCVDGTVGTLVIYCTHGGDVTIVGEDEEGNAVTKLSSGVKVKKGNRFYEQGDDLGWNLATNQPITIGTHIHMNVKIGHFEDFLLNSQIAYYLPNDKFIEDVFLAELETVYDFNDKYYDTRDFVFISEFNPEGKINGWHTYYGEDYYVLNEVTQKGWISHGDDIYYTDLVTGVKQIGWVWLTDAWYYFGTDGKLYYGWLEDGEETYYLDPDNYGAMVNDEWATIDGEYYYFKNGGQLQENCWILDGTIPMYYVDSTGKRLRGWVQLAYPEETAINWFYFNNPNDYNVAGLNSGQLARNKWIASGSNWYYVGQEGKMLT